MVWPVRKELEGVAAWMGLQSPDDRLKSVQAQAVQVHRTPSFSHRVNPSIGSDIEIVRACIFDQKGCFIPFGREKWQKAAGV
jgi:hypothetical protein